MALNARVSTTAKTAQPIAMPDPAASVETVAVGRTRVRWNTTAYPMAMLRDATTGKVIGFVRASGTDIATGGRSLEVVYSDGVRSVVQKLR
jgi:hypothetical protein